MSPATVATSTVYHAASYGFQRKGFYAAGLFWAFYHDGTNAGWEFSNDGITWTGAFTSIGACNESSNFSIWFDGTYVHYIRTDQGGTFDTYYRRGTPENDGSITWCDDEQLVYSGTSSDAYWYPCISVDTNGYAWIGSRNKQPDGDDFPVVLKNANNDGTWALDFVTELSAVDSNYWKVCPVPLTSGKVYVIYCISSQPPLGKLYDGGWGGEESNLADYAIEDGYGFSAVADGDDVHFVYNRDVAYEIRYNKRTFGVGWGANDVLVQDHTSSSLGPTLSIDAATGDFYCFWTQTDTDHVYYKKCSAGSWDVAATDWINESTDDIKYGSLISSYYQYYSDYIGLLYVTKLASPYKVRFEFLTKPPPPSASVALYAHAIIQGASSAELYGHVIIQYTSEELYGHGVIRHASSEDLYGYFVVQYASEELYGYGIIRHANSEDLYGYFVIQYPSVELYGYGIIRHASSAELYGYAEIKNASSAELYGYALIIHFVDLYGHAEIKHSTSADLYGYGIIKNIGSAELYGYAEIRHVGISIELYSHAIIRTIGSAEIYGCAEIRQLTSIELYGHVVIRNIGFAEMIYVSLYVRPFELRAGEMIIGGLDREMTIGGRQRRMKIK